MCYVDKLYTSSNLEKELQRIVLWDYIISFINPFQQKYLKANSMQMAFFVEMEPRATIRIVLPLWEHSVAHDCD